MKAAVLREVRTPLQIEEVKISKPGPHEVLIRTAAAGVCHSDLHFIEGSYPAQVPVVLGHESAGIVEQVGSEVRTISRFACSPPWRMRRLVKAMLSSASAVASKNSRPNSVKATARPRRASTRAPR